MIKIEVIKRAQYKHSIKCYCCKSIIIERDVFYRIVFHRKAYFYHTNCIPKKWKNKGQAILLNFLSSYISLEDVKLTNWAIKIYQTLNIDLYSKTIPINLRIFYRKLENKLYPKQLDLSLEEFFKHPFKE